MLLAGCSHNQKLMPLEVGNIWTYQCTSGLLNRVATLKIDEQTAVGQHKGYALESEFGQTTMAWQNDKLIVGKLANSEFFPPLPIYANLKEGKTLEWTGTLRHSGTSQSAKATLTTLQSEEKIDGKKVKLTVGQVNLVAENEKHELTTWFYTGKGIYLQEHRINDKLATRLRYVSGP